ncbi:MAG TPA: tetratricopeptide repeat protein [Lacipirellula sp.]
MPRREGFVRRPALGLAVILMAFAAWAAADWYISEPPAALAKAHYVGTASCVSCHQPEAAAWKGSHHDQAMDVATDATVLGDFNDAEFNRLGQRTRFFRDGKRFMVNAEGPDGEYRDYEVKYTFGVHPLQQYMVEFPDGRIQVLRVSWDVEKKEWFYVAPMDVPDERIPAGDPFHWTGFAQNWNTMCAECHVTDYHKNYDLATNTYKSEYQENDVGCEACHGPGSLHVELANGRSMFWDRNVRYGLTNTLKNVSNERQLNTCAPCHSRRSMIHPDYTPGDNFLDHFEPSLLQAGLYHADGQILDEVFEYGSFKQSRMFREGVKCTDCHDPHSVKLKYDGNRLCAQCHQPGKYDGPAHHHHVNAAPGAPETQCVTCHMPTTVYMGIDARRDHSIRVPRPDLTVELGTPNVCNRCHTKPEEDAKWASERIVEWYGEKRPDDPHFAPAIHAAQRRQPGGDDLIRRLLRRRETPEIVKATAVELLQNYHTEESLRMRKDALTDPSPLVRAAAIRSYPLEAVGSLIREIAELLNDPVRSVRLAAASLLAANAQELLRSGLRPVLDRALEEYRAGQMAQLDRAEANRNLGSLSYELGDTVAAVEYFRTAIRLQPERSQLRTELSQMLAAMAADPDQTDELKEAGGSEEEIRRLREEEVKLLARDARLLPGDPGPHYHRGRLLVLLDRYEEARDAFREACRLAPNEYEYWLWLALVCERLEQWEEGVAALQQMSKLRPEADEWKGLRQRFFETIRKQQAEEEAAGGPSNDEKIDAPPSADKLNADEALEEAAPPQVPPGTPGRRSVPPEKLQESGR